MGFSFKIAPGVRVRASSRGVRTSVGPRAARIHVGAGRAGISTGAGPVGAYTSLGGGRRPKGMSGQTPTAGRQAAQGEGQAAATALHQNDDRHRARFAPVERPVLGPPDPPDEGEIRRCHERAALQGIGRFQHAARTKAKHQAAVSAAAEVKDEWDQRRARGSAFRTLLTLGGRGYAPMTTTWSCRRS
ncbi:DUF4236 domain-containing protein [Streptomyces sp. GP55]|uniref:DUF4236 domain-containing protein n=1 Tax=Kitasatospora sp. GP30 TaxID=3035084 RepID=UPI0015D5C3BB